MGTIRIKRIYDPAEAGDGLRVLVDRVWPRGISKQEASIDDWVRDLAPSTELRKWFNHEPAKWDAFQERYRRELQAKAEGLRALAAKRGDRPMTLLFGARDPDRNQAVVLKQVLEKL